VPIVHALSNAEVPDDQRRSSVFSGNLFVYSPRATTLALAAAARSVLQLTFGPEPESAQQRRSEGEFIALFNEAGESLRQVTLHLATVVIADFGCNPATTFVGPPYLVATTGMGFLAHGLGLPHHPHRDTWYAASKCQINWWIPLEDLDASASFAFHPVYWDIPVHNTSANFDYQQWQGVGTGHGGAQASACLTQPRPTVPIDLTPEIRISCPAGSVIVSSAAQLYSAVPNETARTHFSVHFDVVSQADLEAGNGAENLDANPQGTPLATFVRCSDLSPLPNDLVRLELERRLADTGMTSPPRDPAGQ